MTDATQKCLDVLAKLVAVAKAAANLKIDEGHSNDCWGSTDNDVCVCGMDELAAALNALEKTR